jgi:hypothetical protein
MSGSCPSPWIKRICRVCAVMLCAYPEAFRFSSAAKCSRCSGILAALTLQTTICFTLFR